MSGLLCVVGDQMPNLWQGMFDDLNVLGRDGHGDWYEPEMAVRLGRTQFFNTPEARWEPPVFSAEGCRLIWDGRLDGREPLLAGRQQITDAQLIVEAYRRWGVDCLKYLLGEYVFILWDELKKKLVVGCDVMNGRTVAYYWNGRTLMLSSRATTLLRHPSVSREFNELYIAHTLNLSNGHPPGTTPFKDIHRLVPGCALVLRDRTLQHLVVNRLKQPQRYSCFTSPEACYEQFWHILNIAVKDRLRTERPIASHLTGGLDSTTVILSILEQRPAVHAFTNTTTVFPEFDERESIQAFLERYPQVQWHTANGDEAWALQEPWEKLSLPDDPLVACTIPMHLQLMQKMQDLGCQSVFEGEGGDEVFNVRLCDFRGKGLLSLVLQNLKAYKKSSQQRNFLYRYLLLPNVSPFWQAKYFEWRGRQDVSVISWLQDSFIESSIFQQSLQQKFCSRLPKRTLQLITDYTTRASSVGYRQTYRLLATFYGLQLTAPLQDQRVVEFSLSLNPSLKLSAEHYKIFLRHVNLQKLPNQVLWRPKENYFSPLIYAGLAKGEKPLELLDYLNSSEKLQVYLNHKKLEKNLQNYRQEFDKSYQPGDRYKPQQSAQLFASFTFINWFKNLEKA